MERYLAIAPLAIAPLELQAGCCQHSTSATPFCMHIQLDEISHSVLHMLWSRTHNLHYPWTHTQCTCWINHIKMRSASRMLISGSAIERYDTNTTLKTAAGRFPTKCARSCCCGAYVSRSIRLLAFGFRVMVFNPGITSAHSVVVYDC